jgi:hypothetical protein
MPQTLEAVRHDMEQKTPDTLMGFQRHGVHAIPLAPIAIRGTRGRRAPPGGDDWQLRRDG